MLLLYGQKKQYKHKQPLSALNRNMIWLLPLSALSIAAGHFIFLHYLYHISIETAIADSLVSVTLLALSLWGAAQSIRLYPTSVGVTVYSLFIAVFFSLSTVYLSTFTIKWWTETTDTAYLEFLDKSGPVRYVIYWLLCSWVTTYVALQRNILLQEKKFKHQADSATLLKEAELFKLRQQLQPHFLYNSLNSISALTMIEPAKAQEMIGMLSDFLRTSVQRDGKESVPLEDELTYLKNYLSIEAIRFGDRLNVDVNNTVNINAHTPPFLLQPLLENAIKFGLYGNTGRVTITVDIVLDNGLLQYTILNPCGADHQSGPRGTGFGLAGVQRRLYLLFARTDLLETKRENDTFITTLKIPQEHVQGNTDR